MTRGILIVRIVGVTRECLSDSQKREQKGENNILVHEQKHFVISGRINYLGLMDNLAASAAFTAKVAALPAAQANGDGRRWPLVTLLKEYRNRVWRKLKAIKGISEEVVRHLRWCCSQLSELVCAALPTVIRHRMWNASRCRSSRNSVNQFAVRGRGAIAPPPVKPTKVTLFIMIFYNSGISIRNIRPFCRALFCEVCLISLTAVNP